MRYDALIRYDDPGAMVMREQPLQRWSGRYGNQVSISRCESRQAAPDDVSPVVVEAASQSSKATGRDTCSASETSASACGADHKHVGGATPETCYGLETIPGS